MVSFLVKYFLPDYWFECAICEQGQATSIISSGLISLKRCDPKLMAVLIDVPFWGSRSEVRRVGDVGW